MHRLKDKSGFVLYLTVFIILFISSLFIGAIIFMTVDTQISENMQKDLQASYLAEAGFEYGVYSLRRNISWMTGNFSYPDGSENHVLVNFDSNSSVMTSMGKLPDLYQKTLQANVTITPGAPLNTVSIRMQEDTFKIW